MSSRLSTRERTIAVPASAVRTQAAASSAIRTAVVPTPAPWMIQEWATEPSFTILTMASRATVNSAGW